jgi:hypothetical protein
MISNVMTETPAVLNRDQEFLKSLVFEYEEKNITTGAWVALVRFQAQQIFPSCRREFSDAEFIRQCQVYCTERLLLRRAAIRRDALAAEKQTKLQISLPT